MNTTPNPLIPQGTFLEQKGRSHIRIAVFTILAVHVVLLGSLLMAGCKRTTDQATVDATNEGGVYPPPPVTTLPPAPETQTPVVATTTSNPPAPTPTPGPGPTTLTPLPNVANAHSQPPPAVIPQPEPVTPPVPTPAPQPNMTFAQGEHVVVKGESFYTIAKKYAVTSRAIQEANPGVDPARLKIGQKLVIPAKSASAMASASSNGGNGANGGKTYTVKSGDTLNGIARRHSVTVKDLQSANNLRTTQIKVGQKLRIPAKGDGTAVGAGNPGALQ